MTDNRTAPVPPRSGTDTWDLIENALRELAGRRGGWLGDPLTAITMLASLIDQAGRMIPGLAADARRERASWTDIATALCPMTGILALSTTAGLRGPFRLSKMSCHV